MSRTPPFPTDARTPPSPGLLPVDALDAEAFAPYGWMLGKRYPTDPAVPAFTNAATDFWREHLFDTGGGGDPELLWVNYRSGEAVTQLEVHRLTQQAIVPLTGAILHVVALDRAIAGRGPDAALAADADAQGPDLSTVRAFLVPPGQGICMRPGVWHASRVRDAEVTCLMLTRRSTTLDLIPCLRDGAPARESALVAIAPLTLSAAAA